jgi:hypothetical protein
MCVLPLGPSLVRARAYLSVPPSGSSLVCAALPLGPIALSLQMFSEELCSRRRRQQSTPHRQAHRIRPHATRPVSLCVQAPKTAGSELAELNAVALCTELQHAYSNRTLISSIVKVRSAPPL